MKSSGSYVSPGPVDMHPPISQSNTHSSVLLHSELVASDTAAVYSEAFHIPTRGRWDGSLQDICEIVDNMSEELALAEIVEVECRKQMNNLILHRFILFRMKTEAGRDVYLRLDRRADTSVGICGIVSAGGTTSANDCAMLAVTERPLLSGPASTIEATYPLKHGSCRLGDLVHFLRICCEELIRYCVWPDNCWFFVSLITDHIARRCPDDINLEKLQNITLAKKVRRRIHTRHHIESGQSWEYLSYMDQLEYLLFATKGQMVIGTNKSAQQLIKLENFISKAELSDKKKFANQIVVKLSQAFKIFRGIRIHQPLLTTFLSETLHDVWCDPRKVAIFRDVSKRFHDEAALRGLAPGGSKAMIDFADLGWKLVKYRLYLPATDAALLMRGVERLARRLLEKEPSLYHQGLMHETLTAYGEELNGPAAESQSIKKLEPATRKRDVFRDAVTMARLLNEAEPGGAHLDSFADSLGSYCLSLVELGEKDKARDVCKESIEKWRLLYHSRFEDLKDLASRRQVFKEWCWCYCTDEKPCEALNELLVLVDITLKDDTPIDPTIDFEVMFERYGPFLTAAAAAPKNCKTVKLGSPQS